MKKFIADVKRRIVMVAAMFCLIMAMPPAVQAQEEAPAQQQLDQMLAPIALYPDSLVAPILMAATYPLEIVEAQRWLQQSNNASLHGDQLAAVLEQLPWDPSVKSLVPFPQIIGMMDSDLQWTEQLGDAFLADEAAVMDSVQRLRQEAWAAGRLQSTPQQIVTMQDDYILISPADPRLVYVPYYNPAEVYGAWPYPDYPPVYFPPPSGYGYGGGGFGFGSGIVIITSFWGWHHWDWHHHRIDIDDRRFRHINHDRPPVASGVWRHDPSHRGSVPYRSEPVRARFQHDAEGRHGFRRDNGATINTVRPLGTTRPTAVTPPAIAPVRQQPEARTPQTFTTQPGVNIIRPHREIPAQRETTPESSVRPQPEVKIIRPHRETPEEHQAAPESRMHRPPETIVVQPRVNTPVVVQRPSPPTADGRTEVHVAPPRPPAPPPDKKSPPDKATPDKHDDNGR